MATDVIMPKLGLTMERGTIAAWLKAEGDHVRKGEALLEVETDKVTMEVEAQVEGVVGRILVAAGEEVDVATPIAIITAPGEILEEVAQITSTVVESHSSATSRHRLTDDLEATTRQSGANFAQQAPESTPSQTDSSRRPHRASPKARKIAAEMGLDLASIAGSGPGGRVVSADLEALPAVVPALDAVPPPTAVSASASTPISTMTGGGARDSAGQTSEVVNLSRAQQVAAQRLTSSYREAPHIQVQMVVAAHWLDQFRGGYAAEGKRVSYNDLILRAVSLSLHQHPRLNSHFVDGQLRQLNRVDLGIATDTPDGLLVPVIRDVLSMSIEQIADESRRLVSLARDARLGVDEMTGGSFTVSNLGMLDVSSFTAIINPPQVAILAVGAVEQRVVAVDDHGAIGVRPMLTLNLAADHRAIDGAMAARFLQHLRDLLESPALLA